MSHSTSPSLYHQYFTPQEIALLDASPSDDPTSEINLLRVLLTRLLEASQHARELALKQHSAMLATISRSAATIARLARLQCKLHSPPLDELWAAIAAGEERARRSLHIYSYLDPPHSASAPPPPAPASLFPSDKSLVTNHESPTPNLQCANFLISQFPDGPISQSTSPHSPFPPLNCSSLFRGTIPRWRTSC